MNFTEQLILVNQAIKNENLVILTWGNASFRCKNENAVYIKPSGVPFNEIKPEQISKVNLLTGEHISGLKPSVDTPTHLEIYENFEDVNCIIHTHSKYCTIFAQAKVDIPCLGTTHADYFYGDIPVVADLTAEQIENQYEKNTGLAIVEHFLEKNINPLAIPAALSPSHGVFVWGSNMDDALKNAIVLENIAEMAYKTINLCYNQNVNFDQRLLDKHFLRKHGKNKYYGQ